jgi:copper oxidase (laccase) domain-containing protein
VELFEVALPLGEAMGVAIPFPAPRPGDGTEAPLPALRLVAPIDAPTGGTPRDFPGEPEAFLSFASAGDMKFRESACCGNRERFLALAGLVGARTLVQVLGLELTHSRRVLVPSRGEEASIAEAARGFDGLLLRDTLFVATVTVADCMPIWLLDRGSGIFGVLHSGWKGTGILAEALRVLEAAGCDLGAVALILGPAIGACCYEVGEDRAETFRAEFGELAAVSRGGKTFLDMRAANLSIARTAGVGRVLSVLACTSCDLRLGSSRRSGGRQFTRMLAAAGWAEAGASGAASSGGRHAL